MLYCARCKTLACSKGEQPESKKCPGLQGTVQAQVYDCYLSGDDRRIALASARTEAFGYKTMNRLEEIMDFAARMDYHKLGVAFCIGLQNEAALLLEVLENNNFQVCSIICKNGGISKEKIGLKDSEKVRPGTQEMICNPIAQATLLAREKTDLNIIMGLCVGHDTLFIKYSQAPVTYFAVKDRVLAHNPMAALYCQYIYRDI